MFRQTLLRAARPTLRAATPRRLPALRGRRAFATGPNGSPPPNNKQLKILRLLDRWIERSPKFMRKPLVTIRHSPASYIVSFAILHEVTAIVPLVALASAFHYYRWLPPYFAEGKWVVDGVEKIGRWFRRRGWIDAKEEADVEIQAKAGKARMIEKHRDKISQTWNKTEGRGRLLVEVATAYAIVKFLVPVRLVLSAFWAPWFATRVLLPVGRGLRSIGSARS